LGGKKLRSLSFDEKFRSGAWEFNSENPDLVKMVEHYAAKGHILLLGCGGASITSELAPHSYETLLGLDLSSEAIARAKRHGTEKARFRVADMVAYECVRRHDVILLQDSLYYVPWRLRKRLLRRFCRSLTTRGRLIVVIAHPDRYLGILRMIRRNFKVEVDRPLEGEKRHVVVFS